MARFSGRLSFECATTSFGRLNTGRDADVILTERVSQGAAVGRMASSVSRNAHANLLISAGRRPARFPAY